MFTLEEAKNAPKGEQRYSSTFSLTSVLDRGGPSTPHRGLFIPGKKAGNHFTGGCVGARAGLEGCSKSRPHQNLMPGPFVISHALNSYLAKLILVNIVTL